MQNAGGIFGATLGLERELRRDNATRSADTQRLGLRWGERLGEGHLLASLDWKRIRSDSAAVDREDLSARVQYALAKPILGAHVALWGRVGPDGLRLLPPIRAVRGAIWGANLALARSWQTESSLASHRKSP